MIQVMLEDVDINQSVVSSAIISSTEVKMIDNNIEVVEPVLYHNDKDTPMYGAVTEKCDNAKKMTGEV